jgi:hypothetical protein
VAGAHQPDREDRLGTPRVVQTREKRFKAQKLNEAWKQKVFQLENPQHCSWFSGIFLWSSKRSGEESLSQAMEKPRDQADGRSPQTCGRYRRMCQTGREYIDDRSTGIGSQVRPEEWDGAIYSFRDMLPLRLHGSVAREDERRRSSKRVKQVLFVPLLRRCPHQIHFLLTIGKRGEI